MRWFLCWSVLAVAILMPPLDLGAQEPRRAISVAELGPQVGELIPEFQLPDQNGRVWTRDSIMGSNGALVLFHRSADW
jgi:hypothetical protein